MGKLEPKHWALIGAMLISISAQIGGMQHGWHDALTPSFVSAVLFQLGIQVTTIFVGPPKQPWDGTLRRGADDRATKAAIDQAVTAVVTSSATAATKAAEGAKP